MFAELSELAAILKEADEVAIQNLRLHAVEALDLILARDELRDKVPALHAETSPGLAVAMVQDGLRLAQCVGSLAVTKQRRVFDALVDAAGDAGVESLLPLINKLPARSINELCGVLKEKGYIGKMNAFLKIGILHRTLSSEALAWLCRERTGIASDVFGPEMSGALLSAMERDHMDEENRKANRVYNALIDDRELIADLITGVELPQVRIFARQICAGAGAAEVRDGAGSAACAGYGFCGCGDGQGVDRDDGWSGGYGDGSCGRVYDSGGVGYGSDAPDYFLSVDYRGGAGGSDEW